MPSRTESDAEMSLPGNATTIRFSPAVVALIGFPRTETDPERLALWAELIELHGVTCARDPKARGFLTWVEIETPDGPRRIVMTTYTPAWSMEPVMAAMLLSEWEQHGETALPDRPGGWLVLPQPTP